MRVQDIADAAGVQIPILYRKFGNREQLIQAAQIERLGRALDNEFREVQAVVDRATTAEQFRSPRPHPRFTDTPERRRAMAASTGSAAYGRPLAAAVRSCNHAPFGIAARFVGRSRRWLRNDLDIEAFAAWFAGQIMGRIVIELQLGIDRRC